MENAIPFFPCKRSPPRTSTQASSVEPSGCCLPARPRLPSPVRGPCPRGRRRGPRVFLRAVTSAGRKIPQPQRSEGSALPNSAVSDPAKGSWGLHFQLRHRSDTLPFSRCFKFWFSVFVARSGWGAAPLGLALLLAGGLTCSGFPQLCQGTALSPARSLGCRSAMRGCAGGRREPGTGVLPSPPEKSVPAGGQEMGAHTPHTITAG